MPPSTLSYSPRERSPRYGTERRSLGARYDAIIEAIKHADVVYADETGWHILGAKNWCWHFKNKEWDETRAHRTDRILSRALTDIIRHRWSDTGCRRLIKRIDTYQRELLTCLRFPNVLPENNTAERGVRPVVVHRKITNGNRSAKGAQTYSINRTVIETLRMEGGNLMEKLRRLLYTSAWSKYGYTMP